MDALTISDGESPTPVSEDLKARLCSALERTGYRVDAFELYAGDAAPCRGCLRCLTKHPGQCATCDLVGDLMHRVHLNPDDCITVSATPARFGQPSSVIRNALDRGAGSRRLQVVVGYGEDIDAEEESTFIDLTARHCGATDIVHPGMVQEAVAFATRSSDEKQMACESVKERL